jgi:hypothetical protein
MRFQPARCALRAALPVFLLGIHGCGDGATAPPAPALVAPVAGHEMSAPTAGAAGTVTVRITDGSGRPMADVQVAWAVTGGGGGVQPPVSRSDAAGEASAVWTLGNAPGANTLTATVAGLAPVPFAAVALAATATISLRSVVPDTAPVTTRITPAPAVAVLDAGGNPMADVTVSFSIADGNGSVTGAQQQTDAEGVATVGGWTLGTAAGTQRLQAVVIGMVVAPASFLVHATPDAPATLARTVNHDQHGRVGTALDLRPGVRVLDRYDNPLAGVPVAFSVTGGGGSVSGGQQQTDEQGVATVGAWTLGTVAGWNTLAAAIEAEGLAPAEFGAHGHNGPPALLTVAQGDGQVAGAGTGVPIPPAVHVGDQYGNPVFGMPVAFAVATGGGTVLGASSHVDSSGLARPEAWVLGTALGTNTLVATVTGLDPVTFTAVAEELLDFDLAVEAVHLNQGTQAVDGSVGGVSERPGLLRVFVRASAVNVFTPPVRVRLFAGGTLLREALLAAPAPGVPAAPDIDDLLHSWNLHLEAHEVVAGLSVEAEVDPEGTIPVRSPGEKRFPRGAGAASLDVALLHPLRIVFIPVHATVHDATGNVTTGNVGGYLPRTRQWIPTSAILPTVVGTYTTALDLNVGSNWPALLAEIQAKRTAESAQDEYYYGIVPFFAGMPWAGYGYVPSSPASPFRSGVSADGTGGGGNVLAHELGHNMGRRHAPCGNVTGPDPDYPYPNADIGPPGYDAVTGQLVASAPPYQPYRDYMSYCGPRWTSDYTYDAILQWRRDDPLAVPASGGSLATATAGAGVSGLRAGAAATGGVLVWGRIGAAGLELSPAFALEAAPVLPDGRGPHVLRGADAAGRELFRHNFEGTPLGHGTDPDERHFAFFLPLRADEIAELATLEVTARTRTGVRTAARTALGAGAGGAPGTAHAGLRATDFTARVDAAPGGRLRLRWDAERQPMALVRDRVTGEVLSFARGGEVRLRASRGPDRVEVLLSDGVRSRPARLAP